MQFKNQLALIRKPSLVCLPQDSLITSRPDAASVGLGAMKQPLAVVTRTCPGSFREPCRARRGEAFFPIDPFIGPFEAAGAADALACDVRCFAATHDIPEPSSIALEAPVCFVAPVEAQHPFRDDGPVPPGGRGALPTGSIGSLKNPSESQSSLGGQAHPSRCAQALHFEVRGGALQKCSALTWVVFFKSPPAALAGCKPWKRLPATEVCRWWFPLSRPPAVMPVRGRRCMAEPTIVPTR